MKLLIVSKLPGTHKTGTMMLSYLYDVVKPLKSIFFLLFVCYRGYDPKKSTRKYLLIIRLVSDLNFHKNTAGIRYSRIPAVLINLFEQ